MKSSALARAVLFAIVLLQGGVSQANAHATAQPVSIEGNWFVALMIALVALWSLILLIRGILYVDQRDAWLRRGGGNGNDWWISD